MAKEEKMIDAKCSVCNKNMQMPASFLKDIPDGKVKSIPHICNGCLERVGEHLGDDKIKNFFDDVDREMEKMDKYNEMAEKLAEEITNENISSLIDELKDADASEEDKIKESFFRGSWISLFIIANNHEPGFLDKEAKHVKDFHEKTRKRKK
ncbi:MAG: hypothetical protein AABW41_04935 [Nanoarchaeota archaeon]